MKNIVPAALAVALVTACTQPVTQWKQSGVSEEKWVEDRAYCHGWSRQQADRTLAEQPESNTLDATDAGFQQLMNRYDARRSQQSLMEECLRRRGYTPADKNPD